MFAEATSECVVAAASFCADLVAVGVIETVPVAGSGLVVAVENVVSEESEGDGACFAVDCPAYPDSCRHAKQDKQLSTDHTTQCLFVL